MKPILSPRMIVVEKSRTIDLSPKANEISSTFAIECAAALSLLNVEFGGASFFSPFAALDPHLL